MRTRIHVDRDSAVPNLPAVRSIRAWVRAALDDYCGSGRCPRSGDVSIRIVDEPEMRALNARYRGKDYATNVLAFPAELPPGVDVALLGDIVVCAPVVRREAAEQSKPVRAHWAHLLVHGTLHLLGHDHERPRAAAAMEALERRVLATLGFPDPYRIA
jgi:probable rRNA maturation factor